VYLYDVIVIARTFQEHLLNLQKVFQRFCKACLRRNPEKCQLFRQK
jgi:NTP pyrophosphatase (non-canonical NTP hydrolase)